MRLLLFLLLVACQQPPTDQLGRVEELEQRRDHLRRLATTPALANQEVARSEQEIARLESEAERQLDRLRPAAESQGLVFLLRHEGKDSYYPAELAAENGMVSVQVTTYGKGKVALSHYLVDREQSRYQRRGSAWATAGDSVGEALVKALSQKKKPPATSEGGTTTRQMVTN